MTLINSYTGKTSRRSHKKSRLGCRNCKNRKIKCDELKPSCMNCLRHSVRCEYASDLLGERHSSSKPEEAIVAEPETNNAFDFISASSMDFQLPKRRRRRDDATQQKCERSSTPRQSSALAHKPFQFTATDMALFHHFMSCSELGADQIQWQTRMTRWGFQHHYLLHLFLALSGFHLARNLHRYVQMQQILGQDADCIAEAERHYEIAIREIASAVPQICGDNGQILYTGAVFIFICSLARGPTPGEYLAFRDDGDAGYLSLFIGVRSILEICSNVLSLDVSSSHVGSVQAVDTYSEDDLHQQSISAATEGGASGYCPLEQLYSLLNGTYPPENSTYLDYYRVLDRLVQIHEAVRPEAALRKGTDPFPHVFGWLYTLPDSFLHNLQHRQQLALTFFAFFVVLLKYMDAAWFIRGWPEHIMTGIWGNLDDYHKQFVGWPMEKLT
ncbi:hypothetical protein BDV59DRAFT_195415 [Aspergillus ambiguus]|uniref:Zn(II)2Cys6 transcription factor domain-containing protein n=1 Tax=Aspergillus ambiguus TaxID=176160 RepID=UPI003CCD47EF